MDSQTIVNSALEQLQGAASNLTVKARRELSNSLYDLSIKLENPYDTLFRILYRPVELASVQVGVDLGLFRTLVNASRPLTITEISTEVKADPVLIGRLCRFYQSYRFIDEQDKDVFAASNVTKTLTSHSAEAGVRHQFHFIAKVLQELPNFLKETGYENPDDCCNVPFSRAFNTNQMGFVWVQNRPFELTNFVEFMTKYHEGKTIWTSAIPFEEQLKSWTGNRPLFVDVGGGMGAQAADFQKATKAPGRIIVEDLGPTLAAAPDITGIEKLEADFFKPQPILGAKYYYLRNVLHDHTDSNSVKILANIRDAMEHDSVILINEMVVPDIGAHSQSTQLDITMMSVLASVERTRSQWIALLEGQVGLKIKEIRTYEDFCGDSVIECMKA